MLDDVLRKAFALANQRLGLIFLDILWKAIWLIATIAALILAALWFGAGVQMISWRTTGLRDIRLAAGMALFFSVACWFVLEALFRGKLWRFNSTFKVYLLSNIAKC